MNIDLENTLALAVAWAKEVGEIQCSYFRSGHLELETKSTVHDVVTKVDKLSESMLIERIGKCFPELRVGEEAIILFSSGMGYSYSGLREYDGSYVIPAYSTLLFKVKIIGTKENPKKE